MSVVAGYVSSVRRLDARDDRDPLASVSIDGFSVLCSAEVADSIPPGAHIAVSYQTRYKAGSRPSYWLRNWGICSESAASALLGNA